MKTQTNFDKLIELLQTKGSGNPIVEELLSHCLDSEVTYSSFSENSNRVAKEHLLDIYEFRAEIEDERKENPFVLGYEQLMPAFRLTSNEFICISDITSDLGSFIIFTDYEFTDFIGILKSARTLSEIRMKINDPKLQVEKIGGRINHIESDSVFIDGKLKS